MNEWEERYRDGRTGWQRSEANPVLTGWCADGTLPPGRILVPGAGRGLEPLALAGAGFAVTTLDIAPTAVAFQRERLAGLDGQVIEGDVFTWLPETPFDAIYEQTCLCALPPERWEAYAARLALWLRPGGVLAALFMQTDREGGPPFHCDLARMRTLFPPPLWDWPAPLPAPVPNKIGLAEQPAVLRLNADARDARYGATRPG